MTTDLQVDKNGRLRHLLGIDGLPRSLLLEILDRAERHADASKVGTNKLPMLHGKTIVNLFFEPSTRTRTTFELAAKRLSADVVNLQIDASSTSKGESLLDTLKTLEAMRVDLFVVRHRASGAAHFFASHVGPGVAVLNAGDGCHEHPTQALLDVFTLRRHLLRRGAAFKDIVVAIVGDIVHSRVARSDIHALRTLGVREIRAVGPRSLVPSGIETLGARTYHDLDSGLAGADVVMLLRLQKERMVGALLPSPEEFHRDFGLTNARLRALSDGVLVMHPGPINRGIEIEDRVAYGKQSLILEQVSNGIAVRMAVMAMIMNPYEGRSNMMPKHATSADQDRRVL